MIDEAMTAARILVIDDEVQIRRFLRISLKSQGYQVLEAATAAEGLELAATQTPDLVVLDLGLPDADGKAVLEEKTKGEGGSESASPEAASAPAAAVVEGEMAS